MNHQEILFGFLLILVFDNKNLPAEDTRMICRYYSGLKLVLITIYL